MHPSIHVGCEGMLMVLSLFSTVHLPALNRGWPTWLFNAVSPTSYLDVLVDWLCVYAHWQQTSGRTHLASVYYGCLGTIIVGANHIVVLNRGKLCNFSADFHVPHKSPTMEKHPQSPHTKIQVRRTTPKHKDPTGFCLNSIQI